ncbi:hypothetical protein GCM10020358_13130 [Amorphoplanes nipponensis]
MGLVVLGYVPRMPSAALRGSDEILFSGSLVLSSLYLRFAASVRTRPEPGSTPASSSALRLVSLMSPVISLRAALCALTSSDVTIR